MEKTHLGLFLMLCAGVHASSSEVLKRQKRNWIIDSFSIDEGYKGVFPYVLGNVTVEKSIPFFNIHGQGVEKEPKGVLQINKLTGQITVHRPVDFEKYQVIKLTFQALDRHSHAIDTQLGIEVLIIDANDNPPTFTNDKQEISINEATSQGTDLTTVVAWDNDRSKKYQLFDLQIVSVHPEPSDLEFDITQFDVSGRISFKGCLDHETAEKYIIIVEAKGRGEGLQLSSSSIITVNINDGNNHIPVITGQTGSGRVKEGEQNVLVKRLQVTDKDSKGTAAWRAKYQIQGDTNKNFRITTDPETNEGLLYVEKHLDYEDGHMQNVTISVENEIPYSSCKVVDRSGTGLWKVNTETEKLGTTTHRVAVTVIVEDVNEPPIFHPLKKQVTVVENVEAGKYLVTFTASDPDKTGANTIVYKKGDDPADWVSVEPKTGKISTTKIVDRESVFVKNNVYTVPIFAVDNGQPALTGTGTLEIRITDENDNVPYLAASNIDMCQSDGLLLANITAVDPDEEPYGGPFTFRLQEEKKGKWKLDPLQGYSVNLVKEPTVPSGQYELLLEVLDLQGQRSAHNLSVTVCNCKDPAKPNCRLRKASSSFGGGGIGAALSTGTSSRMRNSHRNSMRGTWNGRSGYSTYQENAVSKSTMLPKVLNMMLSKLEAQGEDLGDYAPHVYAEEGDTDTDFEPDACSIPDISFDPDLDLDLDANFNTLASICMPSGSAAHRNS
ncbi:cadherin-2-like [Lycodopsis pacificus]